ncbi:unnamed protein product, partial [Staurois parvus]
CEISDEWKDGTSLKNIFHTQDRNTASPPYEIVDVCKEWTSLKNISHTHDRKMASPLAGMWLLTCVRSLMCEKDWTSVKNISRTHDRNTASPRVGSLMCVKIGLL